MDRASRLTALRRLFEYIQSNHGGLLPLLERSNVIVRDHRHNRNDAIIHNQPLLRTDDLQRLMSHEVLGIHVRGFYPRNAAEELGRELSDQALGISDSNSSGNRGTLRNWSVSVGGMEKSDVWTLGSHPPYNVAVGESSIKESEDAYFEGVRDELSSRRRTRRTSKQGTESDNDDVKNDNRNINNNNGSYVDRPTLWPLDLLRLELDEAWPGGSGLAREDTPMWWKKWWSFYTSSFSSLSSPPTPPRPPRPFSAGLPRIMIGPTRWKEGHVHVDDMAPLDPKKGVFSANVYLRLPPPDDNDKKSEDDVREGRDALQIWPLGIRSRWDWYRNAGILSGLSTQDASSQVELRSELGPPIVLNVEPGDLVMLCVQRPHAAIGFDAEGSTRVSLQCFLRHGGEDERLLIDI